MPIDYYKLSKYIQIHLIITKRNDDTTISYGTHFRRCTLDDFTNNNYLDTINLPFESLFCPDI